MKLFIDVGGTHLRSELHTASEVLSEDLSSQEHDLIEVLKAKLAIYPLISFIGISFAGQIYAGEIISAPNLHISEPKIKEYFESRYNLRLEIDNDLNCAVMAEAAFFKSDSIVALYVGTGLGSAFIDGGRLVRGVHNQAFEIGHIPYKSAPFSCGCTKTNCLELFASASGMDKWMKHLNMSKQFLSELEVSQNRNSRDIALAFKEALLHAAATLITMSNPKILVLGGGIIKRNTHLLEWVKENLEGYAFSNALNDVTVVVSSLKNGAMQGAKLLERNPYES
jgi:glucokinase